MTLSPLSPSRRDFALGVTLALLAGPAHAAAPASYPITKRGNYLFVAARINGRPVQALLDSGAELTLVDRAFAAAAGLTGGASVEARGSGAATTAAKMIEGVTLEAFGRRVAGATVAVVNLSDVARRLTGTLPVVLGREIFDAGPLAIDIAAGTIVPLGAGARAGVRLPLKSEFGIETLPILIEGRPAQATFDLGNGSLPVVSARFAAAAGLLDGRSVGENQGGGLGGGKRRRVITLRSLEVAGRRFDDVQVAIEDGDHASDANIGLSILRAFGIVADFPAHALWLASR